MNKQTKIGFMFMFLLAFALFVSAEVSAITLSYESNDKGISDMKVKINDAFFFDLIKTKEIGTLELKSHKNIYEKRGVEINTLTKEVNPAGIGLIYETNFNEEMINGLTNVKIIDMKTKKEVQRDWRFVYSSEGQWEIPIYKEVCPEIKEIFKEDYKEEEWKSKNCEWVFDYYEYSPRKVWNVYDSKTIPSGKLELGIEIEVKKGDNLDIVLEIGSKSLTKHAQVIEGIAKYIYAGGTGNQSIIKYDKDLNIIAVSPNYGWSIYSIAIDEDYVYYGGSADKVRKAYKTNLTTIADSPDYGDTINSIAIDDDYIYYGGDTNKVRKAYKTNLSTIVDSPSYGDDILSIAIDEDYVYYGGLTTYTVRKAYKTDLTTITNSPSYGGRICSIAIDEDYVYYGGSADKVRKAYKTNLATITNSPSYSYDILSIAIDEDYVYYGGGSDYVRKAYKTDLTTITNSPSYGNDIHSIAIDEDYVYYGGHATDKVRKAYKTNLTTITNSPSYGGDVRSITLEKRIEEVSIILNSPEDNLQSASSAINFNATITPTDATIKNVTLYLNDEEYLDLYDTNETINYSKILTNLEEGDYTWNITACWIGESNEEYCTESDTRTFKIDATLPNITILSGNGTQPYYYSGINHTVNFTIEDDNLDSGWWEYGEENLQIGYEADGGDDCFGIPVFSFYSYNLSNFTNKKPTEIVVYGTNEIYVYNSTGKNQINYSSIVGQGYLFNLGSGYNDIGIEWNTEDGCTGFNISVDLYNLSGTLNISEDNNYSVTFPVTKDVYDFTIYANDTYGNVASEEVEWDYYVYENSVSYNPTTTERKIEYFVFSLTTTSEITAAIFNYDGIRSSANIYSAGTNKTISINDYEIPSIETDKNITFFLELTLTGGIKINSTSYIQSVKNLGFDDCSSNTFPLMNMSLYDEKAKTPLTGTIEVNYWIENALFTNKIATYNNTFSSTSNKRICSNVNLSGQGLYQSAIIRYSATGYVPEFYNVQRAEVDGVQYIKLYDLNESDSTEFLVTYYNDNFIKVGGAILQLLRGYIDKDIYEVVEAPLTSSEGTAIVHVDTKTNLYKAILVKDGVILNTFNDLVFACESPLVTQCEMKLSGKVEPSTSIDTADLQDISYEISTINNTVNFLFSIPSGVTSSVNLIMEQTDSFGTTQLCNKTVSSAGGTIECDFDDTIGESYVTLYVYKDETPIVHKQYAIMEDSPLKFLGNNFFIVFIMLLSVVGMAFSSPEWIIINASVTLLISGSLWLLNGMNFVIGIGAIMWLLVGAIILISKLAKQEDR